MSGNSGGGESVQALGSILSEYEKAEISAEGREAVSIAEALFRAREAGDDEAVAARTEELRERGVHISFTTPEEGEAEVPGGQYGGELWDQG